MNRTECSECRLDDTTQSFQNAGYSQSCSDSSQIPMNGVFKVAIFGHEYVDLLPFYSGETFKSKTPDNSYQVIKYARHGAEIPIPHNLRSVCFIFCNYLQR